MPGVPVCRPRQWRQMDSLTPCGLLRGNRGYGGHTNQSPHTPTTHRTRYRGRQHLRAWATPRARAGREDRPLTTAAGVGAATASSGGGDRGRWSERRPAILAWRGGWRSSGVGEGETATAAPSRRGRQSDRQRRAAPGNGEEERQRGKRRGRAARHWARVRDSANRPSIGGDGGGARGDERRRRQAGGGWRCRTEARR